MPCGRPCPAAGVRPRDPVRATLRRLAPEQLVDLVRLDARLKALKAELKDEIVASESHLMDLHTIGRTGPVGAGCL